MHNTCVTDRVIQETNHEVILPDCEGIWGARHGCIVRRLGVESPADLQSNLDLTVYWLCDLHEVLQPSELGFFFISENSKTYFIGLLFG